MALVTMAGTIGTAGVASAQSRGGVQIGVYASGGDRGDRWDRDERRGDRWDRDDRRGDRYDRREDRREDRAERRRYERWQRARQCS